MDGPISISMLGMFPPVPPVTRNIAAEQEAYALGLHHGRNGR